MSITLYARFHVLYSSFQRLSIGRQWLLTMALCAPLIWAPLVYELKQLRSIAEDGSNRDVANLSHAFAHEINSSIGTIDLSLIGLRAHWMRNRGEFRDITTRLNLLIGDKVIFQVVVTNAQGVSIFSSVDAAAPAVDVSDREHIRVHLQGNGDRLFIGRPVIGRISGKLSVQFSRPVYTPDGKFDGVIVASVSPDYFSRFFREIDLGPGASIALARYDGIVLSGATASSNNRDAGSLMRSPAFDDPHRKPSGHYRQISPADGVERFFAWRTLPRYGLVVTVGQSVADAYDLYARQRPMYLAAGSAVTAVIALLGWLVLSAMRRDFRATSALRDAEARWKFALEGAGDGVWDWNFVTQSATLSTKAQAILQVDHESMACTQEWLHANVHPEDVSNVNAALKAHIDGKTPAFLCEYRVKGRNGSWFWILTRGMVVERKRDGKPLRMVGTFTDITVRKTHEESVLYLSQHDPLTGLPNRSLFADRLHQALLRAQRESSKLALIYFDLDKFKPVNDTFGHDIGDGLLVAVSNRVRTCLRDSDTVARVGGDEFVVLLPRVTDEADAVEVAANILEALNMPFDVGGHQLEISGSLGIATYPTHGCDEATLTQRADRAMYQAKDAGRHCVRVYQPEAGQEAEAAAPTDAARESVYGKG